MGGRTDTELMLKVKIILVAIRALLKKELLLWDAEEHEAGHELRWRAG